MPSPASGSVAVRRGGPPVPGPLRWAPPGDKSVSQRATLLASLAEGTCRISGLLWSADTIDNLLALGGLGVRSEVVDGGDVLVHGMGLRGYQPGPAPVYLGNSATSSRIVLSLVSGQKGTFVVDGNEILRRRPMEWIVEPLRAMGADIAWLGDEGRLPVRIEGTRLRGAEHRARVASAQVVSALLFAGLLAEGTTAIRRRAQARDHTERLFRVFGVPVEVEDDVVRVTPVDRIAPRDLSVPGDISSAAFALALVALHPEPGIELTVEPVGLNPTRSGFLRALAAMGADLEVRETGTIDGEPRGAVTITSGRPLRGIEVSGVSFIHSMIDELPLLAAVAAAAEGPTTIADAAELRDKDSDRIASTTAVLRAFGAGVEPAGDGLVVTPGRLASPGRVETANDHRIIFAAMALASTLPEPTHIDGWEAVRISLPQCLDPLRLLASAEVEGGESPWRPLELLAAGGAA
jgi:3-phosphoshikimate 1-carboxyvinyltransferase